MNGVIFDLDQTIVDSELARPYRGKAWQKAYSLIPKFTFYNGMSDVFSFVRSFNIQLAVVSTSPSFYCKKVIAHFNIPCTHVVGYHDVKNIKPHPEAMLKAMELLGTKSSNTISVGDRGIDIESSKKAGIVSIGCLWGTQERETLVASQPEFLINKPIELIQIVQDFFSLTDGDKKYSNDPF